MMDNRGVASSLNYILGLGIATVLVVGLLIAGGNLIADQREQVVRNELSVLGQQTVNDISTADRFVSESGNVTISRDLPKTVAGEHYRITIVQDAVVTNKYTLYLNSSRTDVSVTVDFISETPVTEASVDGGTILVKGVGKNVDDTERYVEVHNG
jgi:hypothetical protein